MRDFQKTGFDSVRDVPFAPVALPEAMVRIYTIEQ